MEFVSISRLLLKARSSYVRAFLYTETDENDTTYFLLHQMRTILQAIDDLHLYLERKMAKRQRSLTLLRSTAADTMDLNHRQLALIRHGLDNPGAYYTVEGHRRYHGVSYGSARNDLVEVVELGLFERVRTGRAYHYVAPEDLDRRLEAPS